MIRMSLTGIGILTLAANFAFASLKQENPPFKVLQLNELIKQKQVTRIDELVSLIPKTILMNPLLVYHSHALNLDRVTLENPRVVLFNEDASLIMAFTQNPGDDLIAQGKDTLEIIEFDESKHKFKLQELVFDGKSVPNSSKSETNPQFCLKCHGNNPRPIFNAYNSWPGFYGSFGTKGYAVNGSKEFAGLENFLLSKANKPRYRDLDLDGYKLDSIGFKTTSRGMGDLADQVQFSINLMFGVKLENLMWNRLGAKLVKDKNFKKLAPLFYALGEESNRCGPIRDRVKEHASQFMKKPGVEVRAQQLLEKINNQTVADHAELESVIIDMNSKDGQLNPAVDSRGVTTMLHSNLKMLGSTPESPLDQKAFFDLLILMESIFRDLDYTSNDISTTPSLPTAGTFHLKRLGRRLIDEQFFQNLISGIYLASPQFKNRFDSMSCGDLQKSSFKAIKNLRVPNPDLPGILYR